MAKYCCIFHKHFLFTISVYGLKNSVIICDISMVTFWKCSFYNDKQVKNNDGLSIYCSLSYKNHLTALPVQVLCDFVNVECLWWVCKISYFCDTEKDPSGTCLFWLHSKADYKNFLAKYCFIYYQHHDKPFNSLFLLLVYKLGDYQRYYKVIQVCYKSLLKKYCF